MRRRDLLKVAGVLAAAALTDGAEARATAVYIAPTGSDTENDGSSLKPFATLKRALDAVRGKPGTKTLFLRGGRYELLETIVLTEADSDLRIEGWPGEVPVLSGGTALKGWKQSGAGRWETKTALTFEQLYVGSERRYRPRLPKNAYHRIAREMPPADGRTYDRFVFDGADISEKWENLEDIEALCFQIWTMARLKVKRVRESAKIVEFSGGTIGKESYQALAEDKRYILENVKEALSEPGEWYLDRKSGVVTYLPQFEEKLTKTEIVAPRLAELLRIEGAKRVTIQNVTLAHAAWACPPEGYSFYQAEIGLGAAVTVNGGREIAFERCTIRNVGAWGVAFGPGSKGCALKNCTLVDLGAGGIKIGEPTLQKDDEKLTERIAVEECLIAHGGRIHPAGVGVWIGHSPFNKILHNEIIDFYYTGISPGWSWGYGESGCHHNEIGYNRISRIGQGVLSDMGGIYTLGVSPGTTLHHNAISEVESDEYGGWGIYFDEGTTGVIAENNLAYKTKSAPFHQHYGRENIVRNNIFAFGTEAQLMRTRAEEHLSFTLTKNIILWKEGPLLGSNWSGEPGKNFTLSGNLYWKTDGSAKVPTQDATGIVADPKFVDAERGDFRLKPGSPALALGFMAWDLTLAGRTGAKPYVTAAPRAFPVLPPPPAPKPFAESFDETPVGPLRSGRRLKVSVEPDVKDAGIFVTEETASSGKRSLKIVDAPGQKARYNPHFYVVPGDLGPNLTGKFALRWEKGAILYHEWRDGGSPYKVGPSLRVEADGTLQVGGKALMTLPAGQWLTLAVKTSLGTGNWNLEVRLPGRTPARKFPGLACDKNCQKLAWWGFVSDADAATVFYLDDLLMDR